MFTGIITDIGIICKVIKRHPVTQVTIASDFAIDKLDIGCSIACNGVCLTLISKELTTNCTDEEIQKLANKKKSLLVFDLSPETINKTNYAYIKTADIINMERSLKVGDEIGGHFVSGHVDTICEIKSIEKEKNSADEENFIIIFTLDKVYRNYVVDKGSVTLNGVSLTVNKVTDANTENFEFSVNLIPHTIKNTCFYKANIGDKVNFEIDMFARNIENYIKNRLH